ncbi:NAD(P)/FAD-dependent oxidoreductase [Arthrobacter sp. 260]|uniref:NAD(P)/FAD-dependent oxidoreductase n=1 Tax=Arthrobacter sp. 260 TaxID=2735314 RepID=UPI00149287B4|nr:NAD(P)/FAD-dependent oxidoreductase [Arthrobacter sp. 260]NOJ60026.1 NAD(P)/FAD-dependent oxidoreductase [Arthrobacter sp. 260]
MNTHTTSLTSTDVYDVVIVGGGAAGLSAGLMLGRCRRSVAIIDGGEPRNAPAAGVHGFLTRDGMKPAELLAIGRGEVESYGGTIIDGQVVAAGRDGKDFTVTLASGQVVTGKRLLIATGLVDGLPTVPGISERWGRDVLHCPFCHGWEVRDQTIGILATGPMASHQALLFRQWSDNITLFLHTNPMPAAEELEKLAARGIRVVEGTVQKLKVEEDSLRGVVLDDGRTIPLDAVVVGPTFNARAEVFADLGVATVAHESGAGTFIATGDAGATNVPGVWAVGNAANLMAQVLASAADGSWTGAMINMSLMEDELQRDLAAHRNTTDANQTKVTA